MTTSDEDLQKKRENVEKLRQQVADATLKREAAERSAVNDVMAAELDAEAARLEAQLVEAKQGSTKTAVSEGTAAPLAAAKETMEQAVAQQKALNEAGKENS